MKSENENEMGKKSENQEKTRERKKREGGREKNAIPRIQKCEKVKRLCNFSQSQKQEQEGQKNS